MFGKSLQTSLTEYFIFSGLYHISPSNLVTVPFQTVLPHEGKNHCFYFPTQESLGQKRRKQFRFFLPEFWHHGVCGNAPTAASSHMPELFGITSRGMFHTLPKCLSWQQQRSSETIALGQWLLSVNYSSHDCFCFYRNFIPKSTFHLHKYFRKPRTWIHTAVHSNLDRAPILMEKYKFLKIQRPHMSILLLAFTQHTWQRTRGPNDLSLRPTSKRIM